MRLSLMVIGILLPCSSAFAQGFLQPVIRVPVVTAPTTAPSSGYLEIVVTSQMAPLAKRGNKINSGMFGPRLELVAVNLELSTGFGEPPVEYPIALYDLKSKNALNVASVQLGRAQFVAIGNGAAAPVLTFKIRAIPRDLAAEFRQGIEAFNGILNNGGFGAVVPILPQVTAATKILTSFLQPFEQSNPEWKTTLPVGLTNAGLMTLPLDGDFAVVFLRPERSKAAIPSRAAVRRCAGAPTEICHSNTGATYEELPYLLISVKALQYRALDNVVIPALTCTADADAVQRYREAVDRSALTVEQRQAEDELLDRFGLVLDARGGALQADESSADLAFRWVRRDRPRTYQTFWTSHYAKRGQDFDNCFASQVANSGIGASRRWDTYVPAFETASRWRQAPGAQDRTAQLELFLDAITRPMRALGLDSGPAFVSLRDAQGDIEQLLVQGDLAAAQRVAQLTSASDLRSLRQTLESRRSSTFCDRCREVLSLAIGQADTRVAAIERDAAAALVAASAADEKNVLAEAQQSARQVVDVAAPLAAGAELDSLRAQVTAATQALRSPTVSAQQVRTLTAQLQQSTNAVRAVVTPP